MATINLRLLADAVGHDPKLRCGSNNRLLEGEMRHTLVDAVRDDLPAKRAVSGPNDRTAKLRCASEERIQTPAEPLIREDGDRGH